MEICGVKVYVFEDFDNIEAGFVEKSLILLPEERRRKALRFSNEQNTALSVVSYLLFLHALSENGITGDIKLGYEPSGKPYLKGEDNVFFNISHTDCAALCAVSDCPVGADIQRLGEYKQHVAEKVCSKPELALLRESQDCSRLFCKMWTIKESYVKLNGRGIVRSELARICSVELKEKGFLENVGCLGRVYLHTWELQGSFAAACSYKPGFVRYDVAASDIK